MSCPLLRSVDDHFSGSQSRRAEQALRTHLLDCAACRQRYRGHLVLFSLTPGAPPAKERLARNLGLGSRRARFFLPLFPAAALAALLLMVFSSVGTAPPAPRGAELTTEPELHVFRARPSAAPERISGVIAGDDELAFAYRNPRGKKYLMIFARDPHGHLFWYYPAWTKSDDNPASVAIEAGDRSHELPDAVAQSFDSSEIQVRAIFSDEPLRVRQIEELAGGSGKLPLPGAAQISLFLQIRR